MSSYFFDPRDEPPPPPIKKARTARSRYQMTEKGAEALASYRSAVAAVQAETGDRETMEAAQTSWAADHGVEAVDALLLDELEQRPQTILELTRSLDTCGIKRPTVKDGIDRLYKAELADTV